MQVWARRPLTPLMRLYAVEDVLHLLHLRFAMLYEMPQPLRTATAEVREGRAFFNNSPASCCVVCF